MKIVKRLLIGFVILITLTIVSIAILPVIFKDEIVQKVKDIANENVNANVDFGEFDLSIFSSFPNFFFEINEVSIIGKEEFLGDTLAYVGNLNLELDLNSVLSGNYSVKNFHVKDVVLNATVLENGKASWDIAVEDSTTNLTEKPVVEESEPNATEEQIAFGLEDYSLENVNIHYKDIEGEMLAEISKLNHKGKFHMNGGKLVVDTETDIAALTYGMESIKYANNLKTSIAANLEIDLDSMKFKFIENKFSFNKLNLGLNGWLVLEEDHMDFDLEINALENQFEEVLSLLPSIYKEDLTGIETSGDFSLTAFLKGRMDNEKLPSFGTSLKVSKGSFHYADLPQSVNNINIDLNVFNKTGIINDTYIDLNSFNCEIAKSPIDIEFHANNIEIDPKLKGRIQSKLNLANIKKAIPMEEGEDYQGSINANLTFAGLLSSIEKENYEDFQADGNVILMDVVYKSADLPLTKINIAEVYFSPKYVSVENFESEIGKSDLALKGKVENFLPYVFHDDTIMGHLNLTSNYLNLDEIIGEDEVSRDTTVSVSTSSNESSHNVAEEEEGAIEIPGNINFELTSSLKNIDYDNMPIKNFNGQVIIKDSKIEFKQTELEILDGQISLNGKYDAQDLSNPITKMDFGIREMSMPNAFKTFNTIQTLIPIAQKAEGDFSLSLDFESSLTDSMTPVYESLQGKGDFFTKELKIEDSEIMMKIAEAVKNPKLQKIRAEDLKVYYTIKDGKLFVEPFDIEIGGTKTKVSGWNSFDQTMSYKFQFKIPRKDLGGNADKLIGDLEQKLNGLGGTNIKIGEFIDIDVYVEGDMTDPKIRLAPKGASGNENTSLKDQAKVKIKEEADKLKKEAEKKIKEEAQKLKEEGKKKIDEEKKKLKAEAEKKINEEKERIKKEAEEKAKKKAAEELKKKAGGLLNGFGN